MTLSNQTSGCICKCIRILVVCLLQLFSCFCCRMLTNSKNKPFQKILSRTLWKCQTVWNQNRILFKTACKGYQQMIKVVASNERVILYELLISSQFSNEISLSTWIYHVQEKVWIHLLIHLVLPEASWYGSTVFNKG